MTQRSSLRILKWTSLASMLEDFFTEVLYSGTRQRILPRVSDAKPWSRLAIFSTVFLLCVSYIAQAPAAERQTRYPPLPFVSDYGGTFQLTDHTGKQVSNEDFLGRYLILYFGYTDCADICPLALFSIATVLNELGPIGKDITPLFVNLDPERSSLEGLEEYVHYFHPSFIGLTGTPEQTRTAASSYIVRYRNVTESDGTRVVIHSGMIFFLGKDGRVVAYFPHDAPVEWMAPALKEHILGDRSATVFKRKNTE